MLRDLAESVAALLDTMSTTGASRPIAALLKVGLRLAAHLNLSAPFEFTTGLLFCAPAQKTKRRPNDACRSQQNPPKNDFERKKISVSRIEEKCIYQNTKHNPAKEQCAYQPARPKASNQYPYDWQHHQKTKSKER
jgi:hypothetical protein